MVVPDVANPFFAEVAGVRSTAAYTPGLQRLPLQYHEDPQREIACLESLEEKRVDGVLLCSSRLPEEDPSSPR
jgi:LacI family transcriptional regulator